LTTFLRTRVEMNAVPAKILVVGGGDRAHHPKNATSSRSSVSLRGSDGVRAIMVFVTISQ
jgi:hypothetical protein